MKTGNFFAELKRRNVYKVAVAYAVVGWLLVQVATQVFPFFEMPNWGIRLVVLIIAIGFLIALFIAWAFELTPEGIKSTEDADATAILVISSTLPRASPFAYWQESMRSPNPQETKRCRYLRPDLESGRMTLSR
jgi:hypothetical protein